jgi:GNAT superfamily N-acetyltransferase
MTDPCSSAQGDTLSESMVEMDDFEITDVHDESAVAELRERLVAFNVAATGYDEYRSLSCFLRNDDGELDAGIDGFSWGGYAMLEWLWVTAPCRGRGYGIGLVRAFETEAQKRGCRTIRVNTHSFQAPDYYRHLGYEEIGYAEDTPLGYGEHFLVKRLP